MNKILSKICTNTMSLRDDANSQLSGSLVLSSSAIVLRNVVGKVNEGMCLMEN